jgi:hypothetical protein
VEASEAELPAIKWRFLCGGSWKFGGATDHPVNESDDHRT